jgi:hypothetical protein
MDAELIRELWDRGRFFSERFPGAAAAEAWTRVRDRAEQEHATRTQRDTAFESTERQNSGGAGSRSESNRNGRMRTPQESSSV